jgi:MFS transporter, PAT family, beta-lactamase induction signal transducer AmpG
VKRNKKLLLISILYFAEGFPFGIIEQTLPIYFRTNGMSLVHMGLFSLVALPYALKFLWAPAVDFFGHRRHWVAVAQFLMAAFLGLLTLLDPTAPSLWLWACIGCLAIMSATQDIAIDAYSIELLKTSEMGIANGFRQAAYRVALLLSGGMFVALGGWIGWGISYVVAALVLVICGVMSLSLPPVEIQHKKFSLSAVVEPFKDLRSRPGLVSVVLFILLYKLGDLAMGPMVRPFWIERGLSTTEIGLITGTLGVAAAIAGGLAGGLFTSRYGIFHGLWFLGLWQTVSHLIYVWVAAYPQTGQWGVYLASFAESFCSGLGTAAFLAFLMSICNKEYSATQYALLSALFRVAGILAGSLSGWLTDDLGYANYFALAFVLPLPAFLFIFKARAWIPDSTAERTKSTAAPIKHTSPVESVYAPQQPKPRKTIIPDGGLVIMTADAAMDESQVRQPAAS